jgi:hypothetical protein
MVLFREVQAMVLSFALVLPAFGQTPGTSQNAMATASSDPAPMELQQLVAPIALYPDALIGQILAASTYPTQIVEAARWLQQNSGLKGDALVSAVNQQPWDDSVKGLTQFPSVLENMNTNLSWTSSLGDAYFNDSQAVMQAIQGLRNQAVNAGNLASSPQQSVTREGQTIVIQPADPEVVYVPTYSPAAVYGEPIEPYPGYSGWDVAAASAISFGVGTLVGAAFGSGWGWNRWGTNWHGGNVMFNRNNYISRSNTFVNRHTNFNQAYFRNRDVANRANRQINPQNRNAFTNPARQPSRTFDSRNLGAGRDQFQQGNRPQQFNREHQNFNASRGFGQSDRSTAGVRGGTFGGFSQGGSARINSARGSSSFSGGRSFSGGGRSFGGGGGGRSFGGGGGGRSRGGGGGRR